MFENNRVKERRESTKDNQRQKRQKKERRWADKGKKRETVVCVFVWVFEMYVKRRMFVKKTEK